MACDVHLNSASQLPPVDCPLIIEVDGQLVEAMRTKFVESRDRELTFQTKAGEIVGRFKWTYP
jgi:hypothetical protein